MPNTESAHRAKVFAIDRQLRPKLERLVRGEVPQMFMGLLGCDEKDIVTKLMELAGCLSTFASAQSADQAAKIGGAPDGNQSSKEKSWATDLLHHIRQCWPPAAAAEEPQSKDLALAHLNRLWVWQTSARLDQLATAFEALRQKDVHNGRSTFQQSLAGLVRLSELQFDPFEKVQQHDYQVNSHDEEKKNQDQGHQQDGGNGQSTQPQSSEPKQKNSSLNLHKRLKTVCEALHGLTCLLYSKHPEDEICRAEAFSDVRKEFLRLVGEMDQNHRDTWNAGLTTFDDHAMLHPKPMSRLEKSMVSSFHEEFKIELQVQAAPERHLQAAAASCCIEVLDMLKQSSEDGQDLD